MNGGISLWRIVKRNNKICVEWGKENGKMQQVEKTVLEGKQGRNLEEQVDFEIASLVKQKKTKHGYVEMDAIETESVPLPMLAQPWSSNSETKFDGNKVFLQPKLDGLRCIADIYTGVLYSRSRKPFTSLGHISSELLKLNNQDKVRYLDGEVYLHGMDFQTITSQARRSKPLQDPVLQLHVFDCLHNSLNFESRLSIVNSLFDDRQPRFVKQCETKLVEREVDLSGEMHEYIARGYEGVMIRLSTDNIDSGYQSGVRSKSLYKLKDFDQEEFQVLGFQKHAELDTLGSVLLQLGPGVNKTFAATPASTALLKSDLWRNRDLYASGEYLATVKFQGLSKDMVPRFPVLIGMRHRDDC